MSAIDAAIGGRLRAMRLARGMTLEQVAEHMGVTAQQVQKYETGHNRIAAARLLELARHLGAPVAAFFETIERAGDGAPGDPADARGLALAQEFDKLSEPQKRAVLSLVRSLSGAPDDKDQPYGT